MLLLCGLKLGTNSGCVHCGIAWWIQGKLNEAYELFTEAFTILQQVWYFYPLFYASCLWYEGQEFWIFCWMVCVLQFHQIWRTITVKSAEELWHVSSEVYWQIRLRHIIDSFDFVSVHQTSRGSGAPKNLFEEMVNSFFMIRFSKKCAALESMKDSPRQQASPAWGRNSLAHFKWLLLQVCGPMHREVANCCRYSLFLPLLYIVS